jgi:hypothetical protein
MIKKKNNSLFKILYNDNTNIIINIIKKDSNDTVISLCNHIKSDSLNPLLFMLHAENTDMPGPMRVYYNDLKLLYDDLKKSITDITSRKLNDDTTLKWNVIFALVNYVTAIKDWFYVEDDDYIKLENIKSDQNIINLLSSNALDHSIGIISRNKTKSITSISFAWNILGVSAILDSIDKKDTVEIITFDYIHTKTYYTYLSEFNISSIFTDYVKFDFSISEKIITRLPTTKPSYIPSSYVGHSTHESTVLKIPDDYGIKENIIGFLRNLEEEITDLGVIPQDDFNNTVLSHHILNEIIAQYAIGYLHYYDIKKKMSIVYKNDNIEKPLSSYENGTLKNAGTTGVKYKSNAVKDTWDFSYTERKIIIPTTTKK